MFSTFLATKLIIILSVIVYMYLIHLGFYIEGVVCCQVCETIAYLWSVVTVIIYSH